MGRCAFLLSLVPVRASQAGQDTVRVHGETQEDPSATFVELGPSGLVGAVGASAGIA